MQTWGQGVREELTQSINLPFQKYLDALNTVSEGVEFHILSQAAGDIWIESLGWLNSLTYKCISNYK